MEEEKNIFTPEDTPGMKPGKKPKNGKRELISWIKVIVIAVIIGFVVSRFIIVNATVPTGSMIPTVEAESRVIGLRVAYLFGSPKRGDVVIFKFPDDESKQYLKRIIGLPGETVEIIDGKVYIDGSNEPLEEDYLNEKPRGDFGPYEVPEDCYFMLGDNRNNSADSRYWHNTFVKKSQIIAKVYFSYYPHWKWVK